MNDDIYYNTRTIPLAERETFSNAIILLTMVKSKYYYIVGFSRPDCKIEIAFDFESELHSAITESLIIDFASDKDFVLFHAALCNIDNFTDKELTGKNSFSQGEFSVVDSRVEYELKIKKDRIVPTGIEQLNEYILCAKNDIITFIENYYTLLCS